MRARLRIVVAGAVIVVIGLALAVETPGTIETAGLLIVLLAMILVVVQEARRGR
jgi:hypothetical protein